MNLQDVKTTIEQLESEFDSHDFIRKFIFMNPTAYGSMLVKHDNVATAHGEISNYLKDNQVSLHIQQEIGESYSLDILGNKTYCAKWRKV